MDWPFGPTRRISRLPGAQGDALGWEKGRAFGPNALACALASPFSVPKIREYQPAGTHSDRGARARERPGERACISRASPLPGNLADPTSPRSSP
jgi:hypothetical protein